MTTMANGNASSGNGPTDVPPSNTVKSQIRATASGGKADGGRCESVTSADHHSRGPQLPQKAWMSGMNPITQRAMPSTNQNGSVTASKSSNKIASPAISVHGNGAHDRMVNLLANFMGLTTTLLTSKGERYTGIYFGTSTDKAEMQYVMKMTRLMKRTAGSEKHSSRDEIERYVGKGEDHTMAFEVSTILELTVEGVVITSQDVYTNGAKAGFRTDTDISGSRGGIERELRPWIPPSNVDVDQSLEASSSGGVWDQFQANENLFGVRSDYDENIYTTKINKAHPNFRQREAAALQMARRMGETVDREPSDGADWDEEDKFSGVRREATEYPPLQTTQPGRYQPPARRLPLTSTNAANVPQDPAIIASQISHVVSENQTTSEVKAQKSKTTSPARESVAESHEGLEATDRTSIEEKLNKAMSPEETGKTTTPAGLLTSFKQFSEKEKIRLADDRRQRANHDYNLKLNDLRSFSKSFNLTTPVPVDLVGILSKDKRKQEEILENSKRIADQQTKASSETHSSVGGASAKSIVVSKSDLQETSSSAARVDSTRPRPPSRDIQNNVSPRERYKVSDMVIPTKPLAEHGLSQRLAKTQRDRQAGIPVNVPIPLPIHTSLKSNIRHNGSSQQPPVASKTPTSATSAQFNMKASEFIPNPAASSFMPPGQNSKSPSPKASSKGHSSVKSANPADFFGNKKPLTTSQRVPILQKFNPVKRLKEKAEKDGKTKDYAANGGMAFAHATPVTWVVVKDGEEGRSYKDMFGMPMISAAVSPRPSTATPTSSVTPHTPHGVGQIPLDPNGASHQNFVYPGSAAPGLYAGMFQSSDEQRVHTQLSGPSYPTPRLQNAYTTYPVMGQPISGPVPGTFQYPAAMGAMHPQMLPPNGPQQGHFRPYGNTPQYVSMPAQQLTAPMMSQQGSQGPYHASPSGHMPAYATGVQPQYGHMSGYPSPNRAASAMMVPQGSFPGQNAQMQAAPQYGSPYYSPQPTSHNAQMRAYSSPQPQYSQTPSQQFHYPQQANRMASHGYQYHPPAHGQMPYQPTHQPPGPTIDSAETLK